MYGESNYLFQGLSDATREQVLAQGHEESFAPGGKYLSRE